MKAQRGKKQEEKIILLKDWRVGEDLNQEPSKSSIR